jgi:hypothetical protein
MRASDEPETGVRAFLAKKTPLFGWSAPEALD